ncbi:short-chain dehydrogenase TIC 32, chloroplastic-like [Gossypium arboreum]|uniref:short-chain dehydrogenase TIC 32, chloroplastic-like n=1 Tax=Gossypium arboreum TaxID=29729 RepID=UPI0022F19A7E|nr:short-chain dehydrogenase TIC 32, chloroplastic-like [Gossypium arboreum]
MMVVGVNEQEDGVNITAVSKCTSFRRSFHQSFPGTATMHPEVKGKSGQYFKNSNIDQASEHGRDVKLAKKLWDFSIKIVE